VRARLVTFHRQTEPLMAFYRAAGLLHEINGEGDIARVAEQCLLTVRKIAQRPDLGALVTTTA
jgi:adenylate kinase family enzyme